MIYKGLLSKVTDNEFIKIVLSGDSALDIMRKLGYTSTSGGTAVAIKNRITKLRIDTSHFTRNKKIRLENIGRPSYRMDEILIKDSIYLNRNRLKLRLISEKLLEYKCIKCNNNGKWLNENLSLHLDHINGIYNDNRLENLRFLCPNCHSTTDTYCGKNIIKLKQSIK